MNAFEEVCTLEAVENNQSSTLLVSSEIASQVKTTVVNGNVVPLFPTKNGYEYFVFRTPSIQR
ncbi:MAG: hypothetical protein K0R00_3192 [Herbinix sp.]|jgi:hypothetical protein|nr:hypothetical protein [Herbinix sp.]